jgi:hypothetical protein
MPTTDTNCWSRLEQAILDEARKPENQSIPDLEEFFAQHNIPEDERPRLRGLVLAELWERAIKETLGLGKVKH